MKGGDVGRSNAGDRYRVRLEEQSAPAPTAGRRHSDGIATPAAVHAHHAAHSDRDARTSDQLDGPAAASRIGRSTRFIADLLGRAFTGNVRELDAVLWRAISGSTTARRGRGIGRGRRYGRRRGRSRPASRRPTKCVRLSEHAGQNDARGGGVGSAESASRSTG